MGTREEVRPSPSCEDTQYSIWCQFSLVLPCPAPNCGHTKKDKVLPTSKLTEATSWLPRHPAGGDPEPGVLLALCCSVSLTLNGKQMLREAWVNVISVLDLS